MSLMELYRIRMKVSGDFELKPPRGDDSVVITMIRFQLAVVTVHRSDSRLRSGTSIGVGMSSCGCGPLML
jgi:hypothetical protein